MRRASASLLLALGLAQSAASAPLELAPEPVRTLPRHFWGINVNYLLDGPHDAGRLARLSSTIDTMGVQVLRYPGGEKSDGVWFSRPPYTEARPSLIPSSEWPAGDPTLVDKRTGAFRRPPLSFDDFMALCRRTGAAAIVVLPYDSAYGPPTRRPRPSMDEILEHARAWVAYAKRHRFPVKAWTLGNESYLRFSYNGAASAAAYARDLRRLARAIRSVDPTAKIAANGPEDGRKVGSVDEAAGRRVAWWREVLSSAGDVIDYIDLHSYPVYGWKSFSAYGVKPITLAAEFESVKQAVRRWARPRDAARIRFLLSEVNSADWYGHPRNAGWSHRSSFGHGLVLVEILALAAQEPRLDAAVVWNTRWVNNARSPQLWDAISGDDRLLPTGLALRTVSTLLRGTLFRVEPLPPGVFALASREGTEVRLLLINRSPRALTLEFGRSFGSGPTRILSWHGGWPMAGRNGKFTETDAPLPPDRAVTVPARSLAGFAFLR